MIWRTSYSTRTAEFIDLPILSNSSRISDLDGTDLSELGDGIYVGGFGPTAYAQQQIWMKLLESRESSPSGPAEDFNILLISTTWTRAKRQEVESLLPPSKHSRVTLLTDPSRVWEAMIEPEGPTRAFAFILRDRVIRLLMVGPPTEEAWDEFQAAI